jgi:hypothetical protein
MNTGSWRGACKRGLDDGTKKSKLNPCAIDRLRRERSNVRDRVFQRIGDAVFACLVGNSSTLDGVNLDEEFHRGQYSGELFGKARSMIVFGDTLFICHSREGGNPVSFSKDAGFPFSRE